jgi:hypothetical protein
MAERRHPDPEAGYSWPVITVVHPDHGSYRFGIHGTRKRGTDTLTLVAFGNGAGSVQQCDVVFDVAATTASDVVQLRQDEMTEDLGVFLAAKIQAEPGAGVLIVPGDEWGLGGAGREVAYR